MEEERAKRRERAQGPRSVPKNPLLQDTNKTQLFNRQFLENIGQVLLGFPEILGRGISITRVSVRPDFSEVYVFWVSRPSEEETVTQLFEEKSKDIRIGMIEDAGLGQLPRLTFLKDTLYLQEQHMAKLYRDLDLGPDAGSVEDDVKVWEEIDGLKLETDGLHVQRDVIMNKLKFEITKRLAIHRYSDSTVEGFNDLYRQTIQADDGEQKNFMKTNISKFLRERKKMIVNREKNLMNELDR